MPYLMVGVLAEEVSPGAMEPSVERTAHQHPRTPVYLALKQEQACAHSDRPHLSCVSYQPSRREITEVPKGSPDTVEMDSSTIGLLEGDVPTWQNKLSGRLPLSVEAASWGMEVALSGSADDLGSVWGSPGRPIHLRVHNSECDSVVFLSQG